MYKHSSRQQQFYRIASADWEYLVVAQNFSDAASLGLAEMIKKFGPKLNIGFNLVVSQICENTLVDEIFYTPQVLSDIGHHKLGKNLDELCQNFLDKTKN